MVNRWASWVPHATSPRWWGLADLTKRPPVWNSVHITNGGGGNQNKLLPRTLMLISKFSMLILITFEGADF